MTEPESTGYQDSPDTTDPAGDAPETDANDTTLTTDDEAQRADGVTRPGNEAD